MLRERLIALINRIHNDKVARKIHPDFVLWLQVKNWARETGEDLKQVRTEMEKMRNENIINTGPTINDVYIILNE